MKNFQYFKQDLMYTTLILHVDSIVGKNQEEDKRKADFLRCRGKKSYFQIYTLGFAQIILYSRQN